MNTKQTKAKVGVLWRGDPKSAQPPTPENNRLHRVFSALAAQNIEGVPVAFSEDAVDLARSQLLELDGVLVWVDPIMRGVDRSRLDALLREVASAGVWVSAHPDVILKMGTKEVLYATRNMGWGSDTRIYRTFAECCSELPASLATGPRVLKQYRGNGGDGVWKVELDGLHANAVNVLHALRDSTVEHMSFAELLRRCEVYFSGDGRIVDQPFQPRLAEGMIRCYLSQDEVVGFGHQFVTALLLEPGSSAPKSAPPRYYFGPEKAEFQALKVKLESDWVPEMSRICGVQPDALPAVWDADFLLGPRDARGEDTYVLGEINISSVFPVPDEAFDKLAQATARYVVHGKANQEER
ncbi:MAG: Cj0069 family protein [Anaerolineaceae bacterium]